MAVQKELIKSIAYFSHLSPDELTSVQRFVFEKTVERGGIILFEGEPAEVLYFVISGVVKIYKTSTDGKEQILHLIRPGESFNDVPVFNGGANLATAEAMGPVVLYGIKKTALATILKDCPQVSLNILRVLSEKMTRLVMLVEDLSFRHVTGRVARILLEYIGDGGAQHPRLTQQEMAAMAGTVREVIGRALKSLEKDGSVRIERHRIIITDKKSLQETAG
jgi:CRP/FNR family transcriptional regulator